MIDRSNQIFTKIKTAISSLCTEASQSNPSTIAKVPFTHVNQIDNSSSADDLDNQENAVNTTVEITVYTQGTSKLTDAKKIMNLADTEMRSMGFRRLYGPRQIDNLNDTSICRYLARFNRIIANGDTL